MIEARREEGGQIVLLVINIKRANSNERCHYYQRERVKRRFAHFALQYLGLIKNGIEPSLGCLR
jgi:hypothetical protein